MLGWEFPPVFNGGLGVACHGITHGLAAHAQIRLIVPRSGRITQMPDIDLLELQGRSLEEVYQKKATEESDVVEAVSLRFVDVELSGYERLERKSEALKESTLLEVKKVWYEEELLRPSSTFEIKELYGPDLVDRVVEYAELATAVAMEQEFDVIHAHDWMCFLAGLRLKAESGKPLILHVHSLAYDREGPESKSWVYEVEQHAMKQADSIIAVSQYTANIIETHYGIEADKIKVVHNGLFPQEAYRLSPPFHGSLVLYLGRLTEQKGPEYFYETAKHLLEQGRKVHFVIAGRGHLIDTLIERSKEDELGTYIHFTGFLEPDRVKELLAMSTVYLMPSVSEPFGLSAIEAAQMEVPCIISNNSGVKEVLSGAWTADYWKIEEMAQLVGELLDQPKVRRQLVTAQNKDLEGISWDSVGLQIMAVYQEIISSQS